MNILTLLISDWRNLTIVLLLISSTIVGGMWKYERSRSDRLISEVSKCELNINLKDSQIKDLNSSIDVQNQSIKDLNIKVKNKENELNDIVNYVNSIFRQNEEGIIELTTKEISTKDIFIVTKCGDKVYRKDGSEEANKKWQEIRLK